MGDPLPIPGRTFAEAWESLPLAAPTIEVGKPMYQQYYGLRELPFELTPNPKFLFLTRQHREALSTLEYGLSSGKGVTVLIGEAGTGKTTLLHAALQSEHCRHVTCVYLMNPTLTRNEFIEMLSVQFGLSAQAATSKATLAERARCGAPRAASARPDNGAPDRRGAEPQRRTARGNPAPGQQRDRDREAPEPRAGRPAGIARPAQRERAAAAEAAGHAALRDYALSRSQETAAYIAGRIRTAGGDAAKLFTREAVVLIHERSGGIPRTISVMCDNALLTGFGLGRSR